MIVEKTIEDPLASPDGPLASPYLGVRLSADAFLNLPEDGFNYELIDGVAVVSPSPTPRHQFVAIAIFKQLTRFLDDYPIGAAFMELDVLLGKGPTGGDLVYRPEIIFLATEQLDKTGDVVTGAPPLVVEVISRSSRRMDTQTKKVDYERFGVKEYWLIDPQRQSMTFYRNEANRFAEVAPVGETFASVAVPGFVLELQSVRAAFRGW